MMTKNWIVTSLSVIVCASVLSACAPQKRAADQKTARPLTPAGKPADSSSAEKTSSDAAAKAKTTGSEEAKSSGSSVAGSVSLGEPATIGAKISTQPLTTNLVAEDISSIRTEEKKGAISKSLALDLLDKEGNSKLSINILDGKSKGSTSDKQVQANNQMEVSFEVLEEGKTILNAEKSVIVINTLDSKTQKMVQIKIERSVLTNRLVKMVDQSKKISLLPLSDFGSASIQKHKILKDNMPVRDLITAVAVAKDQKEGSKKVVAESSDKTASLEISGLPASTVQAPVLEYKALSLSPRNGSLVATIKMGLTQNDLIMISVEEGTVVPVEAPLIPAVSVQAPAAAAPAATELPNTWAPGE